MFCATRSLSHSHYVCLSVIHCSFFLCLCFPMYSFVCIWNVMCLTFLWLQYANIYRCMVRCCHMTPLWNISYSGNLCQLQITSEGHRKWDRLIQSSSKSPVALLPFSICLNTCCKVYSGGFCSANHPFFRCRNVITSSN